MTCKESNQAVIASLRKAIQKTHSCMVSHQCMGIDGCYKRKNPINCFRKLENDRLSLKNELDKIKAGSQPRWIGKFSVEATYNTSDNAAEK